MADAPLVHVVEDDTAMREAILLLLRSADIPACGYASAEEFLSNETARRPACLLLDVRLPGMDGLALHRHLIALGANPAVVMITGHGDVPMAVAALKAGAVDFVSKPFDPETLLFSLRSAIRQADENKRHRAAAERVQSLLSTLTPREADVFDRLVGGHSNKVIAADLGISTRTVEHHRARIMEKMEARTFSHLIKMALGRID